MLFCDNKYLVIKTDTKPVVMARTVLPSMEKEEIKDIEKKPFICTKNVNFFIIDKSTGVEYRIFIPKSYTYDGASIPAIFRCFIGGKGNPEFLIASCVHDKMCECKWLVNCNRKLSSIIFRELLIACGCPKIKANTMYFAVDNFQKLMKGWENV